MKAKLIELLYHCGVEATFAEYERIARELIANGVRLEEKQATSDESKWIPVTERLPELEQYIYSVDVLFYVDGDDIRLGFVNFESGNWKCRESRTIFRKDYVTHWMPLPEPPKGE